MDNMSKSESKGKNKKGKRLKPIRCVQRGFVCKKYSLVDLLLLVIASRRLTIMIVIRLLTFANLGPDQSPFFSNSSSDFNSAVAVVVSIGES